MDERNSPTKTFTQRVLIVIGLVALAFLILFLFYVAFDVILLVFAGVLLAVFFRGLAGMLGRVVSLGEGWRVVLVTLILLAILAGAIALLAPSIADQVANLREELPRSARAASAYISRFGRGRALIDQLPSIDVITQNISPATLLSGVGGVFSSTVGAIGNFLIVVLLAIYLASEPEFYLAGATKLFPITKRARAREIFYGIGETLSWWLIGKAGSMLFIGLLTWLGLAILGVPLALTLGLIAGLLSFIPNFGPILSAVPALLLAFIDGPYTALKVLGLYVGVQIIESNLVTPLIERETIEMPPALTISAQLALAVLGGGLGLVLATPLLATVIVVVQMVYIEDILGDKATEVKQKDLDDSPEDAPRDAA